MLPQYDSRLDKDGNYADSLYIDNEQDLDKSLAAILHEEDRFLYRGVNDARYQMFASSQRHWLLQLSRITRLGQPSYHDSIQMLINLTYSLQEVKDYMQQQNGDYNEFFILALMQHFGVPSPMIDFSKSALKGLFFAVDNMRPWTDNGGHELDDYISLYYLPADIDWVDCTIQRVMENAAESIERLVSEQHQQAPNLPLDTKIEEANIRHLLFRQFFPSEGNITFLPVGGPSTGHVSINIPILNFSCDYVIINDRLVSQEGLFIFNNTEDQPLVELMNGATRCRYFHCLNIRKHLVPYIQAKYLQPNGIDHDSVYCIGQPEPDTLQVVMNRV